MSLQLLAKQMEAKGRKGDSMLVHMTAGEVAGLQKLAESAGGSLSVNPETGLVEANFLKRLLPTLVGAGLMLTPGGMPLALAGGALVGGLQAKRNDQDFLSGAVMGGLGAYGGASLAGGLTAAGAAGTAGAGAGAGLSSTAPSTVAQTLVPGANVATGAGSQASMLAAQNAGMTGSGIATYGSAANPAIAAQTAAPTTFSGNLAQAGEGIGRLGDVQGRAAFGKEFGFGSAMAGMAPMMMPEAYKPAEEEKLKEDNERFVYDYVPGRTFAERDGGTSAERQFFADQRFKNRRTERVAQGGLLSLAEGGETTAPAEGMSGASAAAFDYLMGRSPSSTGQGIQNAFMQGAMSPQSPMAQPSPTPIDANQMFSFNPATGAFTRNPNYETSEDRARRIAAEQAASTQMADAQPFFSSSGGDNFGGGGGGDAFGGMNGMAGDPSGMGAAGGTAFAAQGGLMQLAKGGMASGGFVVPADVVSALGNGSTDAGLRKLSAMMGDVKPIKGKGDGLSDSIPTNIDGKQPARVADGEAYIDPKTVKRLGGAKKLYAMMDKVRAQAHGKTTQQRKVNPARVMA